MVNARIQPGLAYAETMASVNFAGWFLSITCFLREIATFSPAHTQCIDENRKRTILAYRFSVAKLQLEARRLAYSLAYSLNNDTSNLFTFE